MVIGCILLGFGFGLIALLVRSKSPKLRSVQVVLAASFLFLGSATLLTEVEAAPAPEKPVTSEPVSERERQRVSSLHRFTVEVFIDRPLVGVRRTFANAFDDIILPPKPTSSEDEPRKGDANPRPRKDGKERDAHYSFQEMIAKNFGSFPADGEGTWQLRKVQLVGLVKHEKPVVYETDKVPGMKDSKDVPTRKLDAFEDDALKALQDGGEHLKIARQGNEMRALGAIFAGKRCAVCHDKPGQMLGAFSYSLERTFPKVPKKL